MYHLGQFHDECFKNLSLEDQKNRCVYVLTSLIYQLILKRRGTKMNLFTVRYFAKAIVYGSKYVYQTVPRLLTIWLDMGENIPANAETFKKLNSTVATAIRNAPAYKVSLVTIQLMTLKLNHRSVVHCIPSNRLPCGPPE